MKTHAAEKGGARHRLDIDAKDARRLDTLAAAFQLPRSEVVRRLIRAASECGPALSRDGAAAIVELTRESRAIEFRLREFVAALRGARGSVAPDGVLTDFSASPSAISSGELSAALGDLAPIISRLIGAYAAMNKELNEVTLGYGSRLRSLLGSAGNAE